MEPEKILYFKKQTTWLLDTQKCEKMKHCSVCGTGGKALLWLYPCIFSWIETYDIRIVSIMGSRFPLTKMLCMKPSQTEDTGNRPRGAYVLPGGLLHPLKCLAAVRTCRGNFVYFVKCPVGSKGHSGILSHCC